MTNNGKILVLIRYSIAAEFNKAGTDIFAPEYFDNRFENFKAIALKSLQEQTDKDFKCFLYHSNAMPKNLKQKFFELERENPFLRNIFQDGTEIRLPAGVASNKDTVMTIRLDNDDGLPKNFIARHRTFCSPDLDGVFITVPSITSLKRTKKGFALKKRDYISNSMGLAFICKEGGVKNVFDTRDHDIVRFSAPLLKLPGIGGLQIINGSNVFNHISVDLVGGGKWRKISPEKLFDALCDFGYPEFDFGFMRVVKKKSWWNILGS